MVSRLQRNLLLIGGGAAAVTGLMTAAVGVRESGSFADRAVVEAEAETDERLDAIAQSVYALVATVDESLEQKLGADLAVAHEFVDQAGGFGFEPAASLSWTAVNQFDKSEQTVTLPGVFLGMAPLGQNADAATPTPLVDKVRDTTGSISTVFQRMNDQGDMLRVATNVLKDDGSRAIGTFIPVTNPDGAPNPVLAKVLAGETYTGTAYVVNRWYVTSYEPVIHDGQVAGMLFVGVPQDAVSQLEQAIAALEVGEQGGISVLRTKGADQGRYVYAADEALAGEVMWDATGPDGELFVQELVAVGLELGEGEVGRVEYPTATGDVIDARVSYYAPWDWVIVAEAHREDFSGVRDSLADGRSDMVKMVALAALLAILVAGAVAAQLSRRLSGPLLGAAGRVRRLSVGEGSLAVVSAELASSAESAAGEVGQVAESAALVRSNVDSVSGDMTHMTSQIGSIAALTDDATRSIEDLSLSIRQIEEGADEAARVAGAAVDEAARASETIDRLVNASAEVDQVVSLIGTITEQTKLLALNATIEAARAGESGKGFAVVAEEVKLLADQTARSSSEISTRVQAMRDETFEASGAISRIGETINRIATLQVGIVSSVGSQVTTTRSLAELQQSIARATSQQRGAAGQISERIAQVAEATDSISSSVEGAAQAAASTASLAERVHQAAGDLTSTAADLDSVVIGS